MTTRSRWLGARLTLTLLMTLGVVIGSATAASAHANLDRSEPSAGAELDDAPDSVLLVFTEPPDPALSIVHVLDAGGTQVETTVRAAPGRSLEVGLQPSLPDGVYTVSWRVVSETDGHATAGSFAFGVGEDPANAPPPNVPVFESSGPTPLSVTGRALLYGGIAVLIAAGFVGIVAFGGQVPGRRPVLLGAAAALLAGAVLTVLAERSAVDAGLVELLRSATGRPYAWLLGLAVAASAVAAEAAFGGGRLRLALAAAGGAAVALVRVLGGHAAAGAHPGLEVPLQWVHILAVSTWIGGLLLLVLLLRGPSAGTEPDPAGIAASVRRFSAIALVAVGLVVATGVLRASNELGGIGWLFRSFDSAYGTVLVVKVALATALIGLGALNRYRGIARLEAGESRLVRRVVPAELAVATGVFLLTGALTGLPPQPQAAAPNTSPTAATAEASNFATTIRVTFSATPGTPGPNAFRVQILDYDSGEPVDASSVALRFEPLGHPDVGASHLPLAAAGDAWTAQGTNLSLAGTWRVTATVTRTSGADEVPLYVTTLGPPQHVTQTSGTPTIFTIALSDGASIQAYVDPAVTGTNQVHLTAFDGTEEMPLASATFVAFPPSGPPIVLPTERFSAGHFVAALAGTEGPWTFELVAVARDGRVLQASFDQTITGA